LFTVIAINSVKRERVWPEELIPAVAASGEIFVNALERNQIRLELESASKDRGGLEQRLERENIYLRRFFMVRLLVEHGTSGAKRCDEEGPGPGGAGCPNGLAVSPPGRKPDRKRAAARAIHRMTFAKNRPLVTVNWRLASNPR